MQITSVDVPPRQVRLTVVVPESRMDRALHAAAQDLGKRAKLRGYRPGKFPVRAVAASVGEDVLREEALERLTREVAAAAIRAEELIPSAPASVSVASEEPLTIDVLVPLQPEVRLGDYRASLRVTEESPAPVADADVDEVLEAYRIEMAYLEPVDRAAVERDVVTINVVGRGLDNKVVFEDEALTFRLDEAGMKSALLPQEAQTHIVGHKPGELFEFTLPYPPDWPQEDLRGRAVTFGTKLVNVAEITLPSLDDDFATQVSDAATLAALRERVRSGLETRAISEAREGHAEKVLDALVGLSVVEIPPAVVELEQARMVADVQSQIERQGLSWERWLELSKRSEEQVWNELEPQAVARLQRRLALGAFVAAEGIEVDETAVDEMVQRTKEHTDKRRLPPDKELRSRAGNQLLADQTLLRLLAVAAGNADDPPEEETL